MPSCMPTAQSCSSAKGGPDPTAAAARARPPGLQCTLCGAACAAGRRRRAGLHAGRRAGYVAAPLRHRAPPSPQFLTPAPPMRWPRCCASSSAASGRLPGTAVPGPAAALRRPRACFWKARATLQCRCKGHVPGRSSAGAGAASVARVCVLRGCLGVGERGGQPRAGWWRRPSGGRRKEHGGTSRNRTRRGCGLTSCASLRRWPSSPFTHPPPPSYPTPTHHTPTHKPAPPRQAISRTAKHRLERGIWTSPGAGDIRFASRDDFRFMASTCP